jgi:hypothetical protein
LQLANPIELTFSSAICIIPDKLLPAELVSFYTDDAKRVRKILNINLAKRTASILSIKPKYLYPQQEYIKREIAKPMENESTLDKQELKRLEMFRNWEIEYRDYNEVQKELANQQI